MITKIVILLAQQAFLDGILTFIKRKYVTKALKANATLKFEATKETAMKAIEDIYTESAGNIEKFQSELQKFYLKHMKEIYGEANSTELKDVFSITFESYKELWSDIHENLETYVEKISTFFDFTKRIK